MKKRAKLFGAISFIIVFVIFTLAVKFIDVQKIGPNGSEVGFATVNDFIHNVIGVNMTLYLITDWLGLVPVAFGFGFAVLGLIQLIQRKSLLKVDFDILALGVFYIIVISAYLLFEKFAINYRPIPINGFLEASYPSSTTLLVLCVMATAMLQLKKRMQKKCARTIILVAIAVFSVFMVVGRLISGVHWLTDIIGSIILSAALVLLYHSVCELYTDRQKMRRANQ